MPIDDILQEQADYGQIARERERKRQREQMANGSQAQTRTRSRSTGLTSSGIRIDRGDMQVILRVVEIALLLLILRKL